MNKTTLALYILLVISCLACLLSPEMFNTYSARSGFYSYRNTSPQQTGKHQKVIPAAAYFITRILSSNKNNHFEYSQPMSGITLTTENSMAPDEVCQNECASQQKMSVYLTVIGEGDH